LNTVLLELLVAGILGAIAFASVLSLRNHFLNNASPRIINSLGRQRAHLRKVFVRTFKVVPERPRVIVQGPKVKPIVCQICLGRVKEGLEYAKCTCGKVFHPVCLVRTGFCPYCQQSYSKETLINEHIIRPRLSAEQISKRKAEIKMLWESNLPLSCPLCGSELEDGSNECQCGAIIVDDGEVFTCPSCGIEVPPDLWECPGCHERFDVVEDPLCPVCGMVVAAENGVCECGALTIDNCPECGTSLGPEDQVCPSCGTAFDFV